MKGFNRAWAMPSGETFQIPPIRNLLNRYLEDSIVSIDPFSRNATRATITNDIDPNTTAQTHMSALDFLRQQPDESADLVLFDPPYSTRQVKDCYKMLKKTVNQQTTQASFWADVKDEIARVLMPGGVCISFGWNSTGIGKTRGFEKVEILMVNHGGMHNDTIVTVDRRTRTLFNKGDAR